MVLQYMHNLSRITSKSPGRRRLVPEFVQDLLVTWFYSEGETLPVVVNRLEAMYPGRVFNPHSVWRLANRRLKELQSIANGAAPEPLRVPEAKTNDSPDGGDHSNETLPQALGRAQRRGEKTDENT